MVVSGNGVLFVTQHLFVQLLAGAQAGKLNFYILTRNITCEFNHLLGQVHNHNGLTHLKDENLISIAHSCGLHHQPASLRNGHKEAVNLGVGYGYRTTLLNLLAEVWNNATVATQHIAKSGGYELGPTLLSVLCDSHTETLTINLCQSLGATHHIGGIDSLVGRNHHQLIHAIANTHIGHILGTEHIAEHCLAGIFLHKGHVFVGCCVEHYLRLIAVKGYLQPLGRAHITNEGHKVQLGVGFFQLQPYLVQGSFGHIEYHELLHTQFGHLATYLRADGACATGNHHNPIVEVVVNLLLVDFNLISTQQVLNADVAHLDLFVCIEHIHLWGYQYLYRLGFTLTAIFEQSLLLLPNLILGSEEYRIDVTHLHNLLKILLVAEIIHLLLRDFVVAHFFAVCKETHNVIM